MVLNIGRMLLSNPSAPATAASYRNYATLFFASFFVVKERRDVLLFLMQTILAQSPLQFY
jgi:hypothetical protein